MINILNLSSSMARNKFLNERPHPDVNGDCSDVKSIYSFTEERESKQISEQRSRSMNIVSGGMPIKMLISQEMCGDIEPRYKGPSVIARLMGLESLPVQQSVTTDEKMSSYGSLPHSLTGEFHPYHPKESSCNDNSMLLKIQSFLHEKKEYKDVYEVQQQPSKDIWMEEEASEKIRYDESSYTRRMALVRQKFIEAKQLATDGKLLDSKEFQDAVDVLNSNRELFLKFLEEPSSMLTKHLFEQRSHSLPSQTTRITVLKPSNLAEGKCDRYMERQLLADANEGKVNKHYWCSGFSVPKGKDFSQPTRIVVLKPSPVKPYRTKTTRHNISPTMLDVRSSSGTLMSDELVSSREAAEKITRQEPENQSSNRKDETIWSSVLSNGYIGDESSFNRSESEYMEDEVGSITDSEVATSATECSWDCLNKVGSPFSASSFNQLSRSPESSVIREAKKRLSERLALVASNVNSLDQIQLRRSSSTLGEMLSIPELKNGGSIEELAHCSKSFNAGDELKIPSAALPTCGINDEHKGENSLRNLSRSKSLPVSCSACEHDELNLGVSTSLSGNHVVQTQVPKSNSGLSSLKNKVSSFFFSKSKKTSEDKPSGSLSISDVSAKFCGDTLSAQTNLNGPDKTYDESERLLIKGVTSVEELGTSGSFDQNQNKYSQILASGAKLEVDVDNGLWQPAGGVVARRPQAVSRSPPIESVARSLSWSSSYSDIASAKSFNPFMVFSKADEEHDLFIFLQKLISSSGIEKKSMIYGRWHSLESPLNPSLLYDTLHMEHEEEKCRARKSNWKLLFDSVNAALLEISQSALLSVCPLARKCHGAGQNDTCGATAVDEIWAIVRKGLSGDKWVAKEPSYGSVMVDRLVKEEVTGRQWDGSRWLELCEFSEEIGEKVLEELVKELLSDELLSYCQN